MNRLYLHALSLLRVPDSSESGVHLQRLHTEGFLRVSCPVPCQAFPVRQPLMGPWHIETGLRTISLSFCVLFLLNNCVNQRGTHRFLWASWTGLTEPSASAAGCASLRTSASLSLLKCRWWGSAGPAGCWWPRLKRNKHCINTGGFAATRQSEKKFCMPDVLGKVKTQTANTSLPHNNYYWSGSKQNT